MLPTIRLALLVALAACSQSPPIVNPRTKPPVEVPARGTATTLDMATWNIEWFGDPSNGPTPEAGQLAYVRAVIAGTDADIWSVQEVVDRAQFDTLVAQLPGYAGLLANDPIVTGGATYYSDFNDREQKVGVVWKTAVATLQEARIVLGGSDYDFGGRPPMLVRLRLANAGAEDVIVIALHMKCCADSTSWGRRRNAATALKAFLDTAYTGRRKFVIGDWNDDVDTSIWTGHASPYQLFVDANGSYKFPTKALSEAGKASTVDYPDMIDHHLVSKEAAATLVPGSVEVYRVDTYVPRFGDSTSDHYPVIVRYRF